MQSKYESNYTFIQLEGGFDEARELSTHLGKVKAKEISVNVIMDVSLLDLIQSFQIGLIVKAKTLCDDLGGIFRLVGDSEEIRDILEVVDLGFIIDRFESLEKAAQDL